MKLRIKAKLMSVHSEVEVLGPDGTVLYMADTDPLSTPQRTRFKDAAYNELAVYTTSRLDYKRRAHTVAWADGRTWHVSRKYRNPASTTESYLTVEEVGSMAVTRRAWTNRFEIRSPGGAVVAEARELASLSGGSYELDVKTEDHVDEVVLLAIITRAVMRADTPAAPAAPAV